MVKYFDDEGPDDDSFSPLLILFMVKSDFITKEVMLGFSPLLILFMVKFI